MRTTFDDLATMFEGSSASGAERAYHRALEKLTKNLVEAGALHVVELKRKSQRKKNTGNLPPAVPFVILDNVCQRNSYNG